MIYTPRTESHIKERTRRSRTSRICRTEASLTSFCPQQLTLLSSISSVAGARSSQSVLSESSSVTSPRMRSSRTNVTSDSSDEFVFSSCVCVSGACVSCASRESYACESSVCVSCVCVSCACVSCVCVSCASGPLWGVSRVFVSVERASDSSRFFFSCCWMTFSISSSVSSSENEMTLKRL